MRIKKQIMIFIIVCSVLLFCSCSSEKRQIRREMNDLAEYLLNELENDNIKIANKDYSVNGIYISLYGSNDDEDISELVTACDRWIRDNQDSSVVSGRLKIAVELYLEKPVERGMSIGDYAVRISNWSNSPDLSPSSSFDCLEINRCDSLRSSVFEYLPDDYRVIVLPSIVEFDDFDVFVSMENLEYLVISDRPLNDDTQRLEAKYEELMQIAEGYPDLHFECLGV